MVPEVREVGSVSNKNFTVIKCDAEQIHDEKGALSHPVRDRLPSAAVSRLRRLISNGAHNWDTDFAFFGPGGLVPRS